MNKLTANRVRRPWTKSSISTSNIVPKSRGPATSSKSGEVTESLPSISVNWDTWSENAGSGGAGHTRGRRGEEGFGSPRTGRRQQQWWTPGRRRCREAEEQATRAGGGERKDLGGSRAREEEEKKHLGWPDTHTRPRLGTSNGPG
jgi:hypothetical protein